MDVKRIWWIWSPLMVLVMMLPLGLPFLEARSFWMGGMLMMLNMVALGWILTQLLKPKTPMQVWAWLLGLKALILFACVWALLKLAHAEPLSLGLAVFAVAIFTACASVPLILKSSRGH